MGISPSQLRARGIDLAGGRLVARAPIVAPRPRANKTEIAYGQHLDTLIACGEVRRYWFQRWTFKLADDCRYTPDFMVETPSLGLHVHEVKGFMRDDALVKLKWCAKDFPYPVWIVRRKGLGWDVERVKA